MVQCKVKVTIVGQDIWSFLQQIGSIWDLHFDAKSSFDICIIFLQILEKASAWCCQMSSRL